MVFPTFWLIGGVRGKGLGGVFRPPDPPQLSMELCDAVHVSDGRVSSAALGG